VLRCYDLAMGSVDNADAWQRKKDGLKRDFGLWAIRHEDIVAALSAWLALRHAGDEEQNSGFIAFGAFVAAYGRLFSGDTALRGAKPWIPPEDEALHAQLMSQRHEAVAHSDIRFRTVHLLPPGIDRPGIDLVPACRFADWRWSVLGAKLSVDPKHVERRLHMLRSESAKRAVAALDELLDHCRGRILPIREMTLDEF
jgi:hypothetical protein